MGILTVFHSALDSFEYEFPSPLEVTGGSYMLHKRLRQSTLCFRPLPT